MINYLFIYFVINLQVSCEIKRGLVQTTSMELGNNNV